MARFLRRLCPVLTCLAVLAAAPVGAQQTRTLASLAGYAVPGLDSIEVHDVTTGTDFFQGRLPALLPPGVVDTTKAPTVAGFAAAGQSQLNLVILFEPLSLPDYLPAITDSLLAGLRLTAPRLSIVPAANAGGTAPVPADLQATVGGASLALVEGSQMRAAAAVDVQLQAWFDDLGLPTSGLPLSGAMPAGAFSGALSVDQVRPLVDLQVRLAAPTQTFLGTAAFTDSVLFAVQGGDSTWDVSVSSGLSFGLGGHTIGFDSVRVHRTLGVTAVDVIDSVSVDSLLGFAVPGLDLRVGSLRLREGLIEGRLGFLERAWDVVIHQPAQISSPLLSLSLGTADTGSAAGLSLSALVSQAQGTILDEFQLTAPTLIYYDGADTAQVDLPAVLQTRLGMDRARITPGIRLDAAAALTSSGDAASPAELLAAVGSAVAGLPLSGALPKRALDGAATLSALRPAIDLGTASAAPSAPLFAGATFQDSLRLRVRGTDSGWDVAVATGMAFAMDWLPTPLTLDVSVTRQDTTTTVTSVTDLSAAALGLASVPGLDGLEIAALQLSPAYMAGRLGGLAGRDWELVVAQPSGATGTVLGFGLLSGSGSDGSGNTADGEGGTGSDSGSDGSGDDGGADGTGDAPTLSLGALLSAGTGTALDDFTLRAPTLVHYTGADASVTPPAPLAARLQDQLRGGLLDLAAGIRIDSRLDLAGTPLTLLQETGLSALTDLPLGGTLPEAALDGGQAASLRPQVDLRLAFEAPTAGYLDGHAAFTDSIALTIQGTDDDTAPWDVGLATRLQFTMGSFGKEFGVSIRRQAGATAVRVDGTLGPADLGLGQVPGLSALQITGVRLGGGYIEGHLRGLVGHDWDLVVARPAVSGGTTPTLMGLGLIADLPAGGDDGGGAGDTTAAPTLSLSSLVPALPAGTPLDDLQLAAPNLIYFDGDAATVDLPAPLATRLSRQLPDGTARLASGFRVDADVDVAGDALTLLQAANLSSVSGLPLGGTLPSAALDGGAATAALRPLIDIQVTIAAPSSSFLGGAASFTKDVQLGVRGTDDDAAPWDLSLASALTFDLGHTVAFDSVRVTHTGGQTEVDALFAATDSMTVGQLLGGVALPGLDSLRVDGIVLTRQYMEGDLTFKSHPWHVLVGSGPVLALWPDRDLRLNDFLEGANIPPIDALSLGAPSLVYAAAPVSFTPPAPLAARLGESSGARSLPAGFTLDAVPTVDAGSQIATLLADAGVDDVSSLRLGGTLDAGALGAATLPDLDLRLPLPAVSVEGASSLTFSDDALDIIVQNGNPSVDVGATVQVSVPTGSAPPPLRATITAGQDSAGDFTRIRTRTISDSPWTQAFGIDWLDVTGLGIDVRVGSAPYLELSGLTDIGSGADRVTGLDVDIAFAADAWSVRLLHADIPLGALVPADLRIGGRPVKLRDLVVSSTAFAGKGWTDPADTLSVVVFEQGSGWNLAIKEERLALVDMVPDSLRAAMTEPLPDAARQILDRIALTPAATVISSAGLSGPVSDLPAVARSELATAFGSDDLMLPEGVGLIGTFDPQDLGDAPFQTLSGFGVGAGGLTMSGAFAVELGQLQLAADLPPIQVPDVLTLLGYAGDPKSSFFVDFGLSGLSFGVGLDQLGLALSDTASGQPGPILEQLQLEVIPEGFRVAGETDLSRPWERALGIPALTLDSGSLSLSLDDTGGGSLALDSMTTTIGTRVLRLDGEVGVEAGALVALALGGELSQLSLADILAMTNRTLAAAGNDTIPDGTLPTFRLQGGQIAFASPQIPTVPVPSRTFLQSYGLDPSGGIALAGSLYVFEDSAPWGEFDGHLKGDGLQATGGIQDLKIGPVEMKNDSLDICLGLDNGTPCLRFNVGGEIKSDGPVFAQDTKVALELSLQEMAVSLAGDAGLGTGAFDYTFRAFVDLPDPNISLARMAGFDMGIDASIELDGLNGWLHDAGPDSVLAVLNTLGAALARAQHADSMAQLAVSTLADSVARARAAVEAARAEQEAQIEATKRKIASDSTHVASLSRDLDNYPISSCHQTHRVCSSYGFSWSRGVYCKHHKRVADWGARAACGVTNAAHRAERASIQVVIDAAEAALEASRDALSALEAGEEALPVDLDPNVARLLLEQHSAQLGVDVAAQVLADAQQADGVLEEIVDLYKEVVALVTFHSAEIGGSLQGAHDGDGAMLTLDYEIDYKTYKTPMVTNVAIDFRDPGKTARSLALVVFQVGSQAVSMARASGTPIPAAIDSLLHPALAARRTRAASGVAKIHQAAQITPETIAASPDSSTGLGTSDALSAAADSNAASRQDSADIGLAVRRANFRTGQDVLRDSIPGVQLAPVTVAGSPLQWRLRDPEGTTVASTDVSWDDTTSIAQQASGPFTVDVGTRTPIHIDGTGELRLALYPDAISPSSGDALTLQVNDAPPVSILSRVDLTRRSWQPLSVPLPPGQSRVERVRLAGHLQGTFHVDALSFDVIRLVGAERERMRRTLFERPTQCERPGVGVQPVYCEGELDLPRLHPGASGAGTVDRNHAGVANSGSSSTRWNGSGRSGNTYGVPTGNPLSNTVVGPPPPRGLTFAMHPGTARIDTLTMDINPGAAGKAAHHSGIDLLAEGHVDPASQRWQIVTIPLDRFAHPEPAQIRFTGDFEGDLFIDDILIVPLESATAIGAQAQLPIAFQLHPSYPNPFNSSATIGFELATDADVTLEVYNLLGQRVATLARGPRPAGHHRVLWHGRDDAGRALASGIYLYRLRADGWVQTRRMLMLK